MRSDLQTGIAFSFSLLAWSIQNICFRYIYLINHADGRTDAHTTGKVCETLPSSYNNMWHYLGDYKCLACSENAKEINNWDLKNGKLIGKIKTEEAILVNSMLVRCSLAHSKRKQSTSFQRWNDVLRGPSDSKQK